MVNTLMAGISAATTIGVVQLNPTLSPQENAQPSNAGQLKIIHWDRRGLTRGDFQPSEKLVTQAIELSQSVLNIWQTDVSNAVNYTFDYENDWAFVCPESKKANLKPTLNFVNSSVRR